MLNILTEHHVGLAFILGVIFLGVILAILLLGYLWTFAWAYLDDGDSKIKNPAFALFKSVTGFYPVKTWGDTWGFVRNKEYDGRKKAHAQEAGIKVYDDFLISFGIPVLIAASPLITLLAVAFYPVTLTIFTLYSVMFVARSVRRLAKRFTKHTTDPNAHKKGA